MHSPRPDVALRLWSEMANVASRSRSPQMVARSTEERGDNSNGQQHPARNPARDLDALPEVSMLSGELKNDGADEGRADKNRTEDNEEDYDCRFHLDHLGRGAVRRASSGQA